MEYDFYLFDADDTLFDYDKAEEKALEQTFSSFGLDYFLDVRHRYGEINKALWRLFEQGKITKSELQTKRFLLLFNEIGINCDAKEFNSKYIVELGKGVYLIDQAENVCKTLYQKHKKIYIVSNGVATTQKMRIDSSAIRKYISGLFVSEEIGYSKPQIEYFNYVFSHIPNLNKNRVVIVGDSLYSDIQGGINANIDTCWFNRLRKIND